MLKSLAIAVVQTLVVDEIPTENMQKQKRAGNG